MAKRVFGYPDIHWRFRDERALAVAMAAQEMFKPDIVVIGGDLMDCTIFSRHEPKKVREVSVDDWVKDELEPSCRFLDRVQEHTGETVMLLGNHEYNIERWAIRESRCGPAIYNLISPKVRLSEGRKNFKIVEWSDDCDCYYQLNSRLIAVHGWSVAKHAAARHLEKSLSKSVIFNHTHRKQVFARRDPYSGKIIEGMSAGCLCKLSPSYMTSPTDWVNGFWVAFVGKSSYTWYPVTIENGRAVMPDGEEIKC